MKVIQKSRRVLVAILSFCLMFALSVGALAADLVATASLTDTPTVTLSDSGNHAIFTLNRQNADLFDQFKSVMPGDTLTQTIRVQSQAGNGNSYQIYLYAREGEAAGAAPAALATSSGDASLPNPSEFLKKLKIQVDMEGRTVDLITAGTGTAGVNLGKFEKTGTTKDILVTLEVPIEMGNEFANASASIDWFFYAQSVEEGSNGGNTGGGGTGGGTQGGGGNVTPTDPPNVDITDPEVPLGNVDPEDANDPNNPNNQPQEPVDIEDPEVPLAALTPISDIPQTGDESQLVLWGTVSVLSGGMLVFLLTGLKKKEE